MFACRVLVREHCQGKKDQPVVAFFQGSGRGHINLSQLYSSIIVDHPTLFG